MKTSSSTAENFKIPNIIDSQIITNEADGNNSGNNSVETRVECECTISYSISCQNVICFK